VFTGPQGPSTTNVNTVKGTASAVAGGLYCMNCHTPHGEFGQLINSESVYTSAGSAGASPPTVQPWATDTAIYWDDPATPDQSYAVMYLYQPSAGAPWQVCTDTSHTTCYYAQTLDAEGQLVSLYGFKLLSSSPNHQYPFPGTPPSGTLYYDDVNRTGARAGVRSYNTDIYNHDGMLFCGTCHSRNVDDSYGGTYHNHPTGCEACHGNPANDATSNDYPHTSTFQYLLQDVPDALCITCHSSRIDWSWGGTNHNHPTGCEACHGNPSDGTSSDYPHSSTSSVLLQQAPDGLCINCHTAGSLP
jgi:hypothetical protein